MPLDERKWLYHGTPLWINSSEEAFFITVCIDRQSRFVLTDPMIAKSLLESIQFGQERHDWVCRIFLIMPDHVHGLFSFPKGEREFKVRIANWKRYTSRKHGVPWQRGFFEHRIRNSSEKSEKYQYILMNPVRKQLCNTPNDWKWVIR